MERVILGMGLIGRGLAEGAIRRGETVAVWNRTRGKTEGLMARIADTIAEAVDGASVVHVVLTADAAVNAVTEAVLEAAPEALIVDHSTNSVAGTAERAARLRERGFRYLHAPVFMNPDLCRSGGGAMVVSGPRDWFEQVEPQLEVMTGRLMYLGERPEAAAAMKLVGNAMIIQTVAALADVFALADAVGIDRSAAHQLLGAVNPANVVAGRGRRMLEGDLDPRWALTMARKDVGLMLEAAPGLPVLSAVAARMDEVIEAGRGDLDLAVIGAEAP